MKRKKFAVLSITLAALASVPVFAQNRKEPAPVVSNKVDLFSLSDVRVTGGKFKLIEDLDHQYLLTLEPDRLLSMFREQAGLTPKGKPYPFWESDNVWGKGPLAGHILGFYMSSMSMMYQTTGDPKILEKFRYILKELKEIQDANGNGYLLATIDGKDLFKKVARGEFTTSNPLINDTWEPVYIMNKIMLGLYDIVTMCNMKEAEPILIKLADWFGTEIIDKLDHEKMQELLVCEHGSINESYVNVYQLTGDKKYLEWAKRLNDEDMLLPLSEGKDVLNGWHANTQIPKFTGFHNVYKYTGDQTCKKAADLFWNIVTTKHIWVNGANSTGEHFFSENLFPEKVPSYGGPESCNSINMMRLTETLYQEAPKTAMIDFYENVLFNHIQANYESDGAMCCYYTPARPGHFKIYSSKYDSFWCCTGTGFEAPAKFGKMIYAKHDSDIFVNMFIPSTVNWTEKSVKLEQITNYPHQNESILKISASAAQNFTLNVRQPSWVEKGSFRVSVNDSAVTVADNADYVKIAREWKNGDQVKITFTPKLQIANLKGSERYYSVKYGAIVLANDLGRINLRKEDFSVARDQVAKVMVPISDAPVLFGSAADIAKSLKQIPGDKLRFEYTSPVGSCILRPFYEIDYSRYAFYFVHVKDIAEYINTVAATPKFKKVPADIDNVTVDSVLIGDASSEGEHNMVERDVMLAPLDLRNMWRRVHQGGVLSYKLKVADNVPTAVYVVGRSTDQDLTAFDIYVDGVCVKKFVHNAETALMATTFDAVKVQLDENLTRGKDKITVEIRPAHNYYSPDLMEIRTLRCDK